MSGAGQPDRLAPASETAPSGERTVTIGALVARLRELDIKIWLDGDNLKVNAPAGVLTAEWRAQLSGRRDELRAFLQAAESGRRAVPTLAPIPRSGGDLPLSFAQERFLFLHRLDPDSVAYTVAVAAWLTGPLRVDLLKRAWQAEVERHEALHVTFPLEVPMPVARPAPVVASCELIEVTGDSPEERRANTLGLANETAEETLDLESGPIARLVLFRQSPTDHLLLLHMHHIVSDQWSLRIMMRDLAAFYNAYLAARQPELPTLPIQYADFAAWERRYSDAGGWQGQLGYWRKQLAGVRVLDMPTDRPRPAVQATPGDLMVRTFPDGLAESVAAFAATRSVSVPMVYLAVFFTLLHRYTAQDDLVVGQPVGGRQNPALEDLVGLFLNTVALRVSLDGNPTFEELLQRVRAVALDAYSHQDFPFERLIAELSPARDASRSPVVQVVFNVVNAPLGKSELEGVEWEPAVLDRKASQFDLSFIVSTDILKATAIEYNTDLFDPPRIERMHQHYRHLLQSAMADPTRRIAELPMLSSEEHQALIRDWNDTAAEYPSGETVVQLVEEQARLTPDAIAVISGDHSLSYAELNSRANQLARHLRTLGAGPDSLVGVGLERSTDMLAAVLGVLKSGAAYVPLDPAFPPQRLAYMIEDSGLRVLVTQESLVDLWAGTAASGIVRLDTDSEAIAGHETANLTSLTRPDHLAYVIYTSGSTGKPKGVQVPHRAFTNFLTSMRTRPGLAAGDVLLAVTTLSFDIAGLELYLPLIVGGTVVLATRDEATDGAALLELIGSHHVTVLQATPATFRLLLDAGWQETPGLRVLCGGEPMPKELAAAMLVRAGAVWNMYGPTETTVWSTVDQVLADDRITIGRPIANTQVYVLDATLHPTAIGVPGELYIGGEGMARGYMGRPELTAERFVPDPFSEVPGARMYRTGDLARFLEDGRLECLGRLDNQVKVRGYRIETGEIEAALAALPSVRDVAVVARPDATGSHQLVAYVVTGAAEGANARDWRQALKATLPDYMVPGVFVPLDALPLTANGKVDRRALPDPEHGAPDQREAYLAPESDTEKAIARIWQGVLNGARVGSHDNFFDLGGHSLLLAQIRAPIQELAGRTVSMVELFQYPTVAALARHLAKPANDDQKISSVRERARLQRQAVRTRAQVPSLGGTRL
jgi:amino acid adenylation domain-containing protein